MSQFDKKSTNSKTSFGSIEKLNNELQNVTLDSGPKVSLFFESDQTNMPQSTNALSNYFGNSDAPDPLFNIKSDVSDGDKKLASQGVKPEEPVVCRLFADTPQPKLVDPTSNFFDAIMQPPAPLDRIGLGLNTYGPEDTYCGSSGNEVNRRRDAWIPSDKTREILIACATSTSGTFVPNVSHCTMPGVLLEEELNDMLQEVVTQYLGAAEATQRKILTAGDVTQDDRGLRELIQANCYRAAVNLTGILLKMYGQGLGTLNRLSKHTPHSLQLWFTRIALLIKIKSFNLAEREAEVFGDLDNPDLYFQFYPDKFGGRLGSIVPFSFRVLLAELPMHCNKPRESMIKLNKILAVCKQILENLNDGLSEDGNPMELNDRVESVELWLGRLQRVQHSIVNCALMQENYSVAIQTIEKLLEDKNMKISQQIALHSSLGRILLQVGDINGSEKCFSKSTSLGAPTDIRSIIDKSLVSIARNNFTEAYQTLTQAQEIDPANIMILNNMAVCLLYTGKLKEAITLLENAINANPTRGLNDSLLLNLCTLYELESSHSHSKKLNLLRQLAKYKADAGINVQQCLKLA